MPYHLSITLGWDEINAREYYSKLTVNVSILPLPVPRICTAMKILSIDGKGGGIGVIE